MSILSEPTKVKFFFSVLFNKEHFTSDKVFKILSEKYAEFDILRPSFNPLTEYYSKEMGNHLERIIFVSKSYSPREKFVPLKLWATSEEIKYSQDSKRMINIDIGLLAKEQVLLATGKPYSHRIYLSDGVYCELVYYYQNKTFHKVPWTYPDYQDIEKIEFFNKYR